MDAAARVPMNAPSLPPLAEDWHAVLAPTLASGSMQDLLAFVAHERAAAADGRGPCIHPPEALTFNALNSTPFDAVKVVILGQDPYHGPGQAHGLCFSVPGGVRFPPSLRNILKEWSADLGLPLPRSGDLGAWASRGVLLLNTTLTVREGQPLSHAGRGWESFTDAVIAALDSRREGLVFMLWGGHAQEKAAMIHVPRHTVLASAHPSPLSARRGFLGSRPFSAANAALAARGLPPVDWSLPSGDDQPSLWDA